MTDPKYPALLAAERWFATEQTRDLVTETECEACAESNYLVALEKLRGLARIAFVTGYEAGKKAFIDGAEARTIASLEAQVGPAEDRIDWQHVDRLRASIGLPPQST